MAWDEWHGRAEEMEGVREQKEEDGEGGRER